MSGLYGLGCEYKTNPMGIDVESHRFSWKLECPRRNARQVSYALTVTRDADRTAVWTGRGGNESVLIPYGGPPLESNARYRYGVVCVLDDGKTVAAEGHFETGLLSPGLWRAKWLRSPAVTETGQCAVFRRDFMLDRPVVRARLYACAMGVYEVLLNGCRVGEDVLAPGWSSYGETLYYQCYDVTKQLRQGGNAVGLRLADGWYAGEFTFAHRARIYGDHTAVILQLMVEYTDGETCVITDESWKTDRGGVLFSSIYDGETFDRRREPAGWSLPGFSDRGWRQAAEVQPPGAGCGAW